MQPQAAQCLSQGSPESVAPAQIRTTRRNGGNSITSCEEISTFPGRTSEGPSKRRPAPRATMGPGRRGQPIDDYTISDLGSSPFTPHIYALPLRFSRSGCFPLYSLQNPFQRPPKSNLTISLNARRWVFACHNMLPLVIP